ncbi:alpha/beta hydrolase [Zhouia sp. PK063]|uniref:alpha/beta hydrolase n=1 Tax=Zhouia sp. PK063 TaxID=3373602 RepID=UPI00378FE3CB
MKYTLVTTFTLLFSFILTAQTRYATDVYEQNQITRSTLNYAIKDGKKLDLDIYLNPNDKTENRPLFVFLYGGGFSGGSKNNEGEIKFAKTVAQKGYVVAVVDYRLTRKNKSFGCDFSAEGKRDVFKAASMDLLDALVFLKSRKTILKFDESKIILAGSSAGAETILETAYNLHQLFPELDNKYKSIHPAAVVSMAGAIIDARYITKENAIPGVFFHGDADKLVPFATAAHHYCKKEDPGYFILDGPVTITKKLKKLHASYLFYSFKGRGHEISGVQYDLLPQTFDFLYKVLYKNEHIQANIMK